MIRFCDKEVVVCNMEEVQAMTRGELISFFIREGTTLMILVFDEEGLLVGSIAYQDVLKYMQLEEYLNPKRVCISENFWEEAREYFANDKTLILPVCNQENQVLGFCYNNHYWLYMVIEEMLDYFLCNPEEGRFIQEVWPFVEQVCITDCNEFAYKIYQICLMRQIPVCLIGEKWEWFGLATCEGMYEYPEEAKCYIYAEGTSFTRKKDKQLNIYGEDISSAFSSVWEIMADNRKYGVYKKQIQLKEKGVEICNVIIPTDCEITNKTKTELDAARMGISFLRYVREYESLSDLHKELTEMFYEKSYCQKYLEEKETFAYKGKKFINGRKELCYVGEKLHNKRIYVIGPCISVASWVRTEENLVSSLQRWVGAYGYSVVACTIMERTLGMSILDEITIHSSDILIFLGTKETCHEMAKESFSYLETLELFNNEEREDWYPDVPMHMNGKGLKCLAEYIYSNYLEEKLQDKMKLDEKEALTYIQKGKMITDVQIERVNVYVESIRCEYIQPQSVVGSIVMNCNPFTYGHQYLIETAAQKVDYLYIFVVEEDRSDYKFADRIKMVQRGTSHLENVIVVPSGNLILSYDTLPIYFEKSIKQEETVDASLDLEIFGQLLAPQLNITYRFVGEEPYDKVTKQYNEQMQIVLSQYGINVVEIPRKQLEKDAISASRVRKLLKEGNYESAKKLVPMTTWGMLERYCDVE